MRNCVGDVDLLGFGVGDQLPSQSEVLVSEAVGKQAEVADANEAFREHVKEEAAQELRSLERHGPLLTAMSIVFPAEGDVLTIEGDEPVVGDSDAMGVTAEITQYLLGSAHGLLGIDDPVLLVSGPSSLANFRMSLNSAACPWQRSCPLR